MKTLELDLDATNSISVEAATRGFPEALLRTSGMMPFNPGDGGTERVADEDSGVEALVDISEAMTKGTTTVRESQM